MINLEIISLKKMALSLDARSVYLTGRRKTEKRERKSTTANLGASKKKELV